MALHGVGPCKGGSCQTLAQQTSHFLLMPQRCPRIRRSRYMTSHPDWYTHAPGTRPAAEVAVRQIELAHVVKMGMDLDEATEAGVLRGVTQGTGVMLLDVSQDKWHILYRNELLDRLAGEPDRPPDCAGWCSAPDW